MQKQRASLPPRYPQVPVCKQDTLRIVSSSSFQAMRFAVEENSNSTSLLPRILLGYETMDICYLTHPVHPILCFLEDNCSTIQIQRNCTLSYPGALSVIGPDSSPAAIRVASILSHVLIPQCLLLRGVSTELRCLFCLAGFSVCFIVCSFQDGGLAVHRLHRLVHVQGAVGLHRHHLRPQAGHCDSLQSPSRLSSARLSFS
ncbi:taste receptor type 1 member 2-like [Crotalus tigris]|uniref:taste receptor type 1 member 2-like n=1 Tax=Crotalus tigris TaxID=88082 RepID=UPI00192F522B|nr:taste receptor type 1 member 2-like [Crotalus tigris]